VRSDKEGKDRIGRREVKEGKGIKRKERRRAIRENRKTWVMREKNAESTAGGR